MLYSSGIQDERTLRVPGTRCQGKRMFSRVLVKPKKLFSLLRHYASQNIGELLPTASHHHQCLAIGTRESLVGHCSRLLNSNICQYDAYLAKATDFDGQYLPDSTFLQLEARNTGISYIIVNNPCLVLPGLAEFALRTQELRTLREIKSYNYTVTGIHLRVSYGRGPSLETQNWHRDYNAYNVYKSFHSILGFKDGSILDSLPKQAIIRYASGYRRQRILTDLYREHKTYSQINRYDDETVFGKEISYVLSNDPFSLVDTSSFHSEVHPEVSHLWVILTYGVNPDFRKNYILIDEKQLSMLSETFGNHQTRFFKPKLVS